MMDFKEFSRLNASRCERWHTDRPWSLSDWATATAGELGEACNIIKKMNRNRDQIIGNDGPENDSAFMSDCLAEELADTLIYVDLLANAAGIDLESAVIAKFNKVSEKYRFSERITPRKEDAK